MLVAGDAAIISQAAREEKHKLSWLLGEESSQLKD